MSISVCFDTSVFDQIGKRLIGRDNLQMPEEVLDQAISAIRIRAITPFITEANLEWETVSAIDRIDLVLRSFVERDAEPIVVPPGRREVFQAIFGAGFKILRGPLLGGGSYLPMDDMSPDFWEQQQDDEALLRQDRSDFFQRVYWEKGAAALRRFGLELAEVHSGPVGIADRYWTSERRRHAAYNAWIKAGRENSPSDISKEWEEATRNWYGVPPEVWCGGIVREFERPKKYFSAPKKLREEVRAITGEWTDMRSLAATYGYGVQYFCTRDTGGRSGGMSLLHHSNWQRLRQEWGIQIVTLGELIAKLPPR